MNHRDLELLSSYLDGRLNPHEIARLESRVHSDPELFSALADIRAARNILRKLPQRKSPRNFTLTRKMVGLNPPLPRSYSFFRFATAFASLLLALAFTTNLLAPRLSYVGQINGGYGGGYGGAGGIGGGGPAIQQSAAATESPVATEAPAVAAPAIEMAPAPASTMTTADSTREVATEAPLEKSAEAPSANSAPQDQPPVKQAAPIPVGWQIAFLVVALVGAAAMFILRQSAKQKWR
jgi:hypothetical protein